jgi:hypothetical protein
MAGALRPDQIDDMVVATLPELGRFRWTDISFTLREHIVADRLMRKERVSFSSGEKIQFNVKVDNGQQAQVSGLYDTDEINVDNVLKTASVPWTFVNTHFAYDNREPAFNSGGSQVLDLLKVRRSEAMQAAVELFETLFWQAPNVNNTLEPYSLQYWIVKNATQGFNGGTPSGFSDVAGLNTTTYPQWRNYTDQYTNVSTTDFCRRARRAIHFCKFKPPVVGAPYSTGLEYTMFTDYTLLQLLEEYLISENDNIGLDLAKYDGNVMLKRIPFEHAAKLDDDSQQPCYGIDWKSFHLEFMSGQYMRPSEPVHGSHNTRAVYYDWAFNFVCRDRRRQFVINTA